jgi:hypothetical protein
MSQIIKWKCDGCGYEREILPETWTSVATWDDGSKTLHYCEACQRKRKKVSR